MNDDDILKIITTENNDDIESLFAESRKARDEVYGKRVFFRGLIEMTNYCKNDCYYCGIRRSNKKLMRYRLSCEEILACCQRGNGLGIKTFVLQGGEDPFFTSGRVATIVSAIRHDFPNHAITLSVGERTQKDYELFFKAGANRFLLRHETASHEHYSKLHPSNMTLNNRKKCLLALKKIGYQVGAGFMAGTPFQTPENLLADIRFLEELQPEMAGIGPFIPQADTPFGAYPQGNLILSLKMIALTRILLPQTLIPAVTAMSVIAPNGRELALDAGANVVMPNLSPIATRKLYAIYNNKASTAEEAAETFRLLYEKIIKSGYMPDMSRADALAV
ncbi:MAG: [FeFe] hydrogenase H-cluster radical SAM maturase HydE [Treponema sp.]|nr:[FeFe] hydrogenase H-cluster radical SAM maturase HydE [Treponema sp.]